MLSRGWTALKDDCTYCFAVREDSTGVVLRRLGIEHCCDHVERKERMLMCGRSVLIVFM